MAAPKQIRIWVRKPAGRRDADHAAAQQRQRHPEDNAGQAHPPQKIQFVQHIPASYISSMARTSGL